MDIQQNLFSNQSATWSIAALSSCTDDFVAQSDVPPEGDSGGTREMKIGDLNFSFHIIKLVISFSLVTHGSSSGVTRVIRERNS